MLNQKNQDSTKDGINPIVAAVTGAVVGAGIAIAGAIALKDEDTRDQVKEVFANAKDQAMGYVEDVKNQVQVKKDQVEERIVAAKKK